MWATNKANHIKLRLYGQKFQQMFGQPLVSFLDSAGFDVIKFDKWLKTPDYVSTKDQLCKLYGEKAVEMVQDLMK